MNAMLYPFLVAMLAATWWSPGLSAPDDEELALRLLRQYEAAVAAYDVKAATALLADDYRGWRNTGREGVGQMVGWMKDRGTALELDLTRAVVAVDGDTARVMDVGNRMGEWESKATYTLTRTSDGWRIKGVEMAR